MLRAPAIVAPQILPRNHFKALKLLLFAREYEKVAMDSAQDRAYYPRYLLRYANWGALSASAATSSVVFSRRVFH